MRYPDAHVSGQVRAVRGDISVIPEDARLLLRQPLAKSTTSRRYRVLELAPKYWRQTGQQAEIQQRLAADKLAPFRSLGRTSMKLRSRKVESHDAVHRTDTLRWRDKNAPSPSFGYGLCEQTRSRRFTCTSTSFRRTSTNSSQAAGPNAPSIRDCSASFSMSNGRLAGGARVPRTSRKSDDAAARNDGVHRGTDPLA
ncbi:MAG: hypothetical protein JWN04_68 [Myxococcaceae bacterium]|nr:hypothetical protein [Myxococcaceae bacterium]